jgi:hypothetical protein
MRIEKRIYKAVAAYSEQTLDYVPANGELLYPETLGGDAPLDSNARVVISWDPAGAEKILFCTYASSECESQQELSGDGTKIFRIRLINNTSDTKEMGGYMLGQNSL